MAEGEICYFGYYDYYMLSMLTLAGLFVLFKPRPHLLCSSNNYTTNIIKPSKTLEQNVNFNIYRY